MANTKQTAKRARQNIKRYNRNRWWKSRIKTFVKAIVVACDSGELKDIDDKLLLATRTLAKAKNKGILKANSSARKISRLTLMVNKAKAKA